MQLSATTWRVLLLGLVCPLLGLVGPGSWRTATGIDFDGHSLNSQHQFSPPQLHRYVRQLLQRYDADGDGQLQANEWVRMRGQPERIDHNGDQLVNRQELLRHVSQYAVSRQFAPQQPRRPVESPAARLTRPADVVSSSPTAPSEAKPFYVPDRFLPPGLPDWFEARDANGDAQLSLAEFAPTGEAQLAAQFQRIDVNRDGLITPDETVRAAGGRNTARSASPTPREPDASLTPSAAP